MSDRSTNPMSYDVCDDTVVTENGGMATKVANSYFHRDNGKAFRLGTIGERLKSKCSSGLWKSNKSNLNTNKNSPLSLEKDVRSSACRRDFSELDFQEEFRAYSAEAAEFVRFAAIDAIILSSNELAKSGCPGTSEIKHQRVRLCGNKRRRKEGKGRTERPVKQHHFRKWLNESQDSVNLGLIYENRRRVCAVAAEAARMATIRNNARKAAKVGAVAAANAAKAEAIRHISRKYIETAALTAAKVAHLWSVRSHARKTMETSALEAAKCAQTKVSTRSVTQVDYSNIFISDRKPFFYDSGENDGQHESQDTYFRVWNTSRAALTNTLREESREAEAVASKIVQPSEGLSAGNAVCSPVRLENEGKIGEECSKNVAFEELVSADSFSNESLDERPNECGSGELTSVVESGDLESKVPFTSNVLGWFGKITNNYMNSNRNMAAENTKTLENSYHQCNATDKTNVWRCFGSQLGLSKEEEAPNSDKARAFPSGDSHIGYAF